MRELFVVIGRVSHFVRVWIAEVVYVFVRTLMIHLRLVRFSVYKFHLQRQQH